MARAQNEDPLRLLYCGPRLPSARSLSGRLVDQTFVVAMGSEESLTAQGSEGELARKVIRFLGVPRDIWNDPPVDAAARLMNTVD